MFSVLVTVKVLNLKLQLCFKSEHNFILEQLLTDPPLLLCDEPTTGLDSYSASAVVEKLHHLVSRGKAVLCSIHQPTSDMLSCFHKLILLAGGRVAFHGTVVQAYTFFSR
jgi:ABC-type multidrug transport system ATPase subunit